MGKFKLLRNLVVDEQLIQAGQIQRPLSIARRDLERIHSRHYHRCFSRDQLSASEQRRIGLPATRPLVQRTWLSVGGTLLTARLALRHGIASHLAGGTHHAHPDFGSGFCIFNDIATAAQVLLDNGEAQRVLVVDLDVHQGDGTAKIFEGDERVFTVSLHGKNNFPFRKQTSDWDVEFENDTGDEEYLTVLDEVLSKLSNQAFDLVFFQAGVDALDSDALGLLKLSREGLGKRNQRVFAWREQMELPMVIFMGGGYAKPIDDTVDAFTDLFMEAASRI